MSTHSPDQNERVNRIAALANAAFFDSEATRKYISGAPHIRHRSLRKLYARLIIQVYEAAKRYSPVPRVLDLGAGEGSVTLPLLSLGARVSAVDISTSQLAALTEKCSEFANSLEVQQADIFDILDSTSQKYDIVVANSFLHHVPDYLSMIQKAIRLLTPHGQFFTFQEPVRYDTAGRFTMAFTHASYISWRLCRGDIFSGILRRAHRIKGIYNEESNNEYHVVRNGVDQDAISELLAAEGFDCRIIKYFSTQNPIFQPIGAALNLENTFAIITQNNR